MGRVERLQGKYRMIPLVAVTLMILLSAHLAAMDLHEVIVEKLDRSVVQGRLIHVDIDDEIIVVKEAKTLSGVKVRVSDIGSIRVRYRRSKLLPTLKDMLVGATAGYVAAEIFFAGFGRNTKARVETAAVFGTLALYNAMKKEAAFPYRYKTYRISAMHGNAHTTKRKKILARLKKKSWRK